MTFKELLDSVTFDDVEKQIVRLYPDMKNSLGWYKLHFDMLRLMKPKHHDGANDDVCHIAMKDWEDGTGVHLHAFPMEGDCWEHSLTKELIIAPEVKATNAELAACCLWHTSYYGFTEEQVSDRFRCYEEWDGDKKGHPQIRGKLIAKKLFCKIRNNGGTVPSVRALPPSKKMKLNCVTKRHVSFNDTRLNKIKRKGLFRRAFMGYYYECLIHISDFIISVIPALSREGNYITIRQLCRLFRSDLFAYTTLESFADEETDSAMYLKELIEKYEMLPKSDNAIIYIARGYEYHFVEEDGITHHVLRDEESELIETISEKIDDHKTYGIVDIIIDVVPKLGHQTLISIVGYNSDNPITYDTEQL